MIPQGGGKKYVVESVLNGNPVLVYAQDLDEAIRFIQESNYFHSPNESPISSSPSSSPHRTLRFRSQIEDDEQDSEEDADKELPPSWTTILFRKEECEMLSTLSEEHKGEEVLEALKSVMALETIAYVSPDIAAHMPLKIFPLQVSGDGNCLLHSLSYMIWGAKSYHKILRRLLRDELRDNRKFYQTSVTKLTSSQEGYPDSEYENFINEASASNAFLGLIHIFALSNILKRPIILYASQEDTKKFGAHESGISGIFLPTRHGAGQCKGSMLALAWSSNKRNHFVPLVLVEGNTSFDWPLLDVAFSKTLKEGETVQDYIKIGRDAATKDSEKRQHEVVSIPGIVQKQNEGMGSPDIVISLCGLHAKIEYRKKEDPDRVAREFVAKAKFPSQFSNPKEKISSILTYERDQLKSGKIKSPVRPYYFVRSPPKCQYIPYDEPYIVRDTARCGPMLVKINEFQIQLMDNPVMRQKYALTEGEQIELKDTIETLYKNPKGYSTTQFRPSGLAVVRKLLKWPPDMVWPAIDLARLLIMYDSAANYYIPKDSNFKNSIFQQIVKWSAHEPTSYQTQLLTLQFYMNLFSQPNMRKILLLFQRQVASMVIHAPKNKSFTVEQSKRILEMVSLIYVNFSLLWKGGNFGEKEEQEVVLKYFVSDLMDILKIHSDKPNVIKNAFIALGTILHYDGRLFIDCVWIESFTQYQSKENPLDAEVIRECARHVSTIQEAPIDMSPAILDD